MFSLRSHEAVFRQSNHQLDQLSYNLVHFQSEKRSLRILTEMLNAHMYSVTFKRKNAKSTDDWRLSLRCTTIRSYKEHVVIYSCVYVIKRWMFFNRETNRLTVALSQRSTSTQYIKVASTWEVLFCKMECEILQLLNNIWPTFKTGESSTSVLKWKLSYLFIHWMLT